LRASATKAISFFFYFFFFFYFLLSHFDFVAK